MRPHCRLEIVYCFCLRTWIFGQTPWTDAEQTSTIRTPLLTGHDADTGIGMTQGAGDPRSSLPAAAVVIVGLNRKDASGQRTDQTMQRYVMLSCVLESVVTQWRRRQLAIYRGLSGGVQ